jgi:hypothetical protein
MLFWLAGGKGNPTTTASWKSQKPRKRMSGLLGMALYGLDAGTEYGTRKDTRDSGAGTGLQENHSVAPKANKPAVKEKAESVMSNKTHSSSSSSSSKRSSRSHSTRSLESSKSAAVTSETQREAPLGSVPEEEEAAAAADVPASDPLPADARPAEDPPLQVPREDLPPAEDAQGEHANAGAQGDGPAPNGDENIGQGAANANGGANR